MENQEADQKFGGCPRVSDRFMVPVDTVAGLTAPGCVASAHGVKVDRRNSWRSEKCGRVWEWLA